MEVVGTLWLTGFDVLRAGQIAFGRAKLLSARKDCALADQEIADGCILDRTGKLKMEIP